jgi:hypothetical protein
MSPTPATAERRSGEVIYPAAFHGKTKPALTVDEARRAMAMAARNLNDGAYREAAKRWDHIARSESQPRYMDDLGPWTVEAPTPMARAIAAIETGVLTEELLFGGIVLRLPPARSPLRALVRQLAARLAR